MILSSKKNSLKFLLEIVLPCNINYHSMVVLPSINTHGVLNNIGQFSTLNKCLDVNYYNLHFN